MAPPVAASLSLIKVPTDNAKSLINSQDTGWEDEEADEDYNPENAVDSEDASLFDPSDTPEEEDLGIPLSQHAPPLLWNDNTVIIDQEDEPQSLIPNSESQGTNWGDADIDDDDDEAEETAWEEEEEEVLPQAKGGKKKKRPNAQVLPVKEIIATKFLSPLVMKAFSTSMFKEAETEKAGFLEAKRQRTSSSTFLPRQQSKRHVCRGTSCGGSTSSSPGMNPSCKFTYRTNNHQGSHIVMACSICSQQITTLRVGGIIKLEGTLGLIRSITRPRVETPSGQQQTQLTLHLQQLFEDLELHSNPINNSVTSYPILKQSGSTGNADGGGSGSSRSSEQLRDTVMLKRELRQDNMQKKTVHKHQNLTIDELNNAWVHGRVEMLPQTSPYFPNIMYCDSTTTCDVQSVDFLTPGACPQLLCSCLNPWKPPPLVLQAGDLVELRPFGEHHVDSLTRLAMVLKVLDDESPFAGDKENENVSTFFAKRRHSAAVEIHVFTLCQEGSEPKTTHDFVLQTETKLRVPMKHVLRKIDPRFDLPPGVCLFDGTGTELSLVKKEAQPSADTDGTTAPLSADQEKEFLTPEPLPPPLLECIDFFCGAGLLSLGLESSQVCKVTFATDIFPAAVKTFQDAHPDANVFCEDVCQSIEKIGAKLARAASGSGSGSGRGSGKTTLNQEQQQQPMRLLVGGPPCQGFSGANTSTSPSQKLEKNVCVAVFIEAIARWRPEFVVIENVKGLLRAPGVLDSIILCLVSLGYQTRVRVVNSGSYGVAQHRVRVVIQAAKHGLPLPEIPAPTHIFHAGGYDSNDPSKPASLELRQQYVNVPLPWRGCVVVPNNALLPREDIRSIIGDLPLDDEVGGEVEYRTEPRSVFQANVRKEVTSNKVYNHETNYWSSRQENLDRISAIPKERDFYDKPGMVFNGCNLACERPNLPVMSGDCRDLAKGLLTAELLAAGARSLVKNYGRFGRLMWSSHCSTILTQSCLRINSDTCGPVIHPDANRVLSVREVARGQGVPDTVRISGDLSDQYRQVGNGVPVPLAEAIGRGIKRSVYAIHSRGKIV